MNSFACHRNLQVYNLKSFLSSHHQPSHSRKALPVSKAHYYVHDCVLMSDDLPCTHNNIDNYHLFLQNSLYADVLTINKLKRETGIDDSQLATMIREEDINRIACLFDEVETFLDMLGLGPAQQTDVKDIAHRQSTTQAMTKALKLWRQPNPFTATFQTLLEILLVLNRGDMALRVCQLINEEVPKHK